MILDPWKWWTWGAQPPSWLLIVERFSDSSFRPSTFLTIFSTTHEKLKTQQEKHSSLKNSITFQCLGEFCLFFKVIPFCLSAPFAATLIHSFVNKKNFQPRGFSPNNILLLSSFCGFMSTRILPYRSYHHLKLIITFVIFPILTSPPSSPSSQVDVDFRRQALG